LFALRNAYQQAQIQLPQLREQLKKDQEDKVSYISDKQKELLGHQNDLSQAQANELHCQQQYKHMKIHHGLAMQRLALTKLEHQRIELQKDWNAIEDLNAKIVSHDFLSLSFTDQVVLLNDIEERLPHFEEVYEQAKPKLDESKKALSSLSIQEKDKNQDEKLLELQELHEKLNKFHSRINTVVQFCGIKREEATTYELMRILGEYETLSKNKDAKADTIFEKLQELAQHDNFIARFSESESYKNINEKKEQLQILALTRLKTQYQDLYGILRCKESLAIEEKINELAAFNDYLTGFEDTPSPAIKKLHDSIINLRNKVTDFKASDFNTYKNKFFQTLSDNLFITSKVKLSNNSQRKEFVENSSLSLNTYITQRNETYWFKDLMSGFAAFFLGCFGYQTESQKRENYVNELNGELENFKNDPSNYDSLSSVIEQGKKEYKPRKGDEEQSLLTVLTTLESDLKPLKPQENIAVLN